MVGSLGLKGLLRLRAVAWWRMGCSGRGRGISLLRLSLPGEEGEVVRTRKGLDGGRMRRLRWLLPGLVVRLGVVMLGAGGRMSTRLEGRTGLRRACK